MQAELTDIAIIGINENGHEDGNEAFCADRDLPWLQDSPDIGIWKDWGVVYRDIFILDSSGTLVDIYNLSVNNLATDYDDLKSLLESHAAAQ